MPKSTPLRAIPVLFAIPVLAFTVLATATATSKHAKSTTFAVMPGVDMRVSHLTLEGAIPDSW
jgi:hypothetical protein